MMDNCSKRSSAIYKDKTTVAFEKPSLQFFTCLFYECAQAASSCSSLVLLLLGFPAAAPWGRTVEERKAMRSQQKQPSKLFSIFIMKMYIFFICTSLVFQPIDFLLESPCSSLLDANLHQLMISGCMRETASRDWKLKLGPLMVSTLLIKKHRIKTL